MEPSSKPPRNGVVARRGKRQRKNDEGKRGREREKTCRELGQQWLEEIIAIVGVEKGWSWGVVWSLKS